jgi:UDP-N-acetyl-2-amino-2-deoxyglucuronate dehydrogenase
VLNPWNIDGLAQIEKETGRKIATILQLRLHPQIVALKQRIDASPKNEFAVDLTYITSRGRWYHTSWKGDEAKSGGVATNIGVHFFDMLAHVFGSTTKNVVHLRDANRAAGYLECGRAKIRWFLSIDPQDLPDGVRGAKTTYRSVTLDGEDIEFSDGFTDLHTRSYEEIAAGNSFCIEEVRASVEIVSAFRSAPIERQSGERHPFAGKHIPQ